MGMMTSLKAALPAVLLLAPTAEAEIRIQEITSPGGHTFWLVEEHSIPIVAVEMGFRGGSRTDPAEKQGLANFTFGLMNEGAGDLDAAAWTERADELSAYFGFDSRADHVTVSARFLSENLEESGDFMALTLAEPRFDAEPIERVRRQILSNLAQSETDPGDIARERWWARAFPDHPYGRDARGTVETVQALTAEDFREAHGRLLTSANAFSAIVGDITPEQAGALVDKVLAGLPEGTVVTATPSDSVPPPGIEVVELDVPQSAAVFGHKGIPRKDPDFIPLYVANYVLGGGGFTSRLMEEVREKRGLAYGVYSYLTTNEESALYMGGVATANERVAESLAVIREEWARMAAEGLTEEDLEKAKTYLTGSFPLRFDSNAKIANFLLDAQLEDLGIDYINIRNDLIEAVTLEDAQRAVARVLDADALSIVVVGKPVGL